MPIYEQKVGPLNWGNFRNITLRKRPLKELVRIIDQRIRMLININEMQFEFNKDKSSIDACSVCGSVVARKMP